MAALGSVADLLHARTVLDPLLHRLDAVDGDDPRRPSEEVARAAAPGAGGGPGVAGGRVGRPGPEQQTAAVALLARLLAKTVGPEEDDDD